MKRIAYLFALMATLASCDRQDARKTFHLTGFPDIEISFDGGNNYFSIEANPDDSWTVKSDSDWFTLKQTFGNGDRTQGNDDAVIQIHADRWTRNSTRTGTVTVTGPGGQSFSKNIIQKPKPVPAALVNISGRISYSGQETAIGLPEGYWVSAKTDASWLTIISCEEGKLVVSADPNPSEDQERTALVHIFLSDETPLADVTVTQGSVKIPAPLP